MTAVYAVTLVVGFVLILAWVAAVAVAESVPGWEHVDPERRFGAGGRLSVAALLGFGLGGMSASFAGWPALAAIGGAVGGALISATGARYLAGSGDTEAS